MKKTLRKPENWQDFESLCKKLWGEIWSCNEIKKNGRSGQEQNGVDVYGIPKGENGYYGIQCKGKDDYTNAKLTITEIDTELEKAKIFTPKLLKFYFATSAHKDSKIEEYIRIKDVEYRKLGLFEVHLFSWEDIVDLIEENKHTFDWYVRNIDHKILLSIKVTFQDDSEELFFRPKLIKNFVTYQRIPLGSGDMQSFLGPIGIPSSDVYDRKARIERTTNPQPRIMYMNGTEINLSSSVFSIKLINNGNTQIENFKLYFEFKDDGFIVDTVSKRRNFLDTFRYSYNTFIYEDSLKGVFEPDNKVLVQKDGVRSDDFCIRPTVEEPIQIQLVWKFVSKDFDEEGTLIINIDPQIEEERSLQKSGIPHENEVFLENYVEIE